jgi:hypothetical protein
MVGIANQFSIGIKNRDAKVKFLNSCNKKAPFAIT